MKTALLLLFFFSVSAQALEIKGDDAKTIVNALQATSLKMVVTDDTISAKTLNLVCNVNVGKFKADRTMCGITSNDADNTPVYVQGVPATNLDQAISSAMVNADSTIPKCEKALCALAISALDCEKDANTELVCNLTR